MSFDPTKILGDFRDNYFSSAVKVNPDDRSTYSMQGIPQYIFPLLGGDKRGLETTVGVRERGLAGENFWEKLTPEQRGEFGGLGYNRGSGLPALEGALPQVTKNIRNAANKETIGLLGQLTGLQNRLGKAQLAAQERIAGKNSALQLQLAQLSSNDTIDLIKANNELALKQAERQDATDLRNWENQVAYMREDRDWKQDQQKQAAFLQLILGGLGSIEKALV